MENSNLVISGEWRWLAQFPTYNFNGEVIQQVIKWENTGLKKDTTSGRRETLKNYNQQEDFHYFNFILKEAADWTLAVEWVLILFSLQDEDTTSNIIIPFTFQNSKSISI